MKMPTNIAFPGLGIEQFTVDKIAVSIGRIEIRWYAIMITMGMVLAFLYAGWRAKQEDMVFDDVIDIGLVTVILGVIGARLYYVLTTIGQFDYSTFIKVIAVWEGGLAIYGGIIGGCIGVLITCYFKKKSWLRAFDMITPGVMLAQAIGRWGNFFNGEAYGYPIKEVTHYWFFNSEHLLPSGEGTLFNALRMGVSHNNGTIYNYYHPTFFYECVWNLIGFAIINLLYKKKRFDGQVALMYFTWYGFGRMLIEGFRTDSLYIPGTTLRISQFLGLACFVVGSVLLTVFLIRSYRNNPVSVVGATLEGVADVTECEVTLAVDEAQTEQVEPACDTIEENEALCDVTEECETQAKETDEDGKVD